MMSYGVCIKSGESTSYVEEWLQHSGCPVIFTFFYPLMHYLCYLIFGIKSLVECSRIHRKNVSDTNTGLFSMFKWIVIFSHVYCFWIAIVGVWVHLCRTTTVVACFIEHVLYPFFLIERLHSLSICIYRHWTLSLTFTSFFFYTIPSLHFWECCALVTFLSLLLVVVMFIVPPLYCQFLLVVI